MNCTNYDWKAYALAELNAEERRLAEAHAATCAGCRDELAGMRLTLDALSTLREEEIPKRIAFVSDKVFEPRWWQIFLRPSFAAACVIALAILAHGFMRSGAADQASIEQAVSKAVARIEQRHAQESADMLAAYDLLNKQMNLMYARNTGMVRQ